MGGKIDDAFTARFVHRNSVNEINVANLAFRNSRMNIYVEIFEYFGKKKLIVYLL